MTNKLEEDRPLIDLTNDIELKRMEYRDKISELIRKFYEETGYEISEIIIHRGKNKNIGLDILAVDINIKPSSK